MTTNNGQKDSKKNNKDNNVSMKIKIFKYTDTFPKHLLYHNYIGVQNNICQYSLYIDKTWIAHLWTNQLFAYFISASEVNTSLTYMYPLWNEYQLPEYAVFRRHLA